MAKGRKPIPKTQKEISESLQSPLETSGPGFSPTGNPNNNINRGSQFSFKDDPVKPLSISLEDLDWAIMYYFQNVIKPFVIQNGVRVEVPIIYGTPEKWEIGRAHV